MRELVPIHQLKRRIPEQGRIRMGIQVTQSGKKRPVKLKRFRFTSPDLDAIAEVGRRYGGEVTPWVDAPVGVQHQVTVTEARIPIALPPDPLGGSPIYEAWSGGGCIRRCDGILCTLQKADNAKPDAEPAVVECLCREQGERLCKPKTRLNVILREVAFAGVWRLESNGWNTAQELPGMVEQLVRLQQGGLFVGYLEIQERQAEQGRKEFIVPAVGSTESIEGIAAHAGRSMLGPAASSAPALEAPKYAPDFVGGPEGDGDLSNPTPVDNEATWFETEEDDEIADAELVDEGEPGGQSDARESVGAGDRDAGIDPDPGDGGAARSRRASPALPAWLAALHAGIGDCVKVIRASGTEIDVNTFRHALVRLVTKGATESSKQLDVDARRAAFDITAELLSGERRFIGVGDDGRLRVSARAEAS